MGKKNRLQKEKEGKEMSERECFGEEVLNGSIEERQPSSTLERRL